VTRLCSVALLVSCALGTGCSASTAQCAPDPIVEPVLEVTNAVTGAALCGVTVTTQGDGGVASPVQVTVIDGGAGCEYQLGLGLGTTVLTVSMAGFASTMVTALVENDDCNQSVPAPSVVQVKLNPD
jgi:hypothetical protein